jgi:hypothetical protein
MHYLLAEAGDRLAGQYAVMPVRLQHDGRAMTGLLSLHTVTDPEFERQGIFTTLARQLYADASMAAPVVFGFPNTNSAPIFYNRLDWVELRPFPILMRPLGNVRGPVRGWQPRLEPLARIVDAIAPVARLADRAIARGGARRTALVEPFDRFGTWADRLWADLAPALGTCTIRDAAYLNWRFTDVPPPFRYERLALTRAGHTAGFAVWTHVPWRGGRMAYLMELMAAPSDRAGARLLLAHVVLDAARAGASAIYAVATRRHPHRRDMVRMGLLPVPQRWDVPRSFGARHNGPGAVPDKLFHIDDWHLSGADLDVV